MNDIITNIGGTARIEGNKIFLYYEGDHEKIIALKRNSELLTLEPGGQIELSGAPLNNIHKTCSVTTNHLIELK